MFLGPKKRSDENQALLAEVNKSQKKDELVVFFSVVFTNTYFSIQSVNNMNTADNPNPAVVWVSARGHLSRNNAQYMHTDKYIYTVRMP